METTQWIFDREYNRITAIDPGNCRITIADAIYGINESDWIANGELMAMAPQMANRIEELESENLRLNGMVKKEELPMSEYNEILKSVVALGYMDRSMVDFAVALKVCLDVERCQPRLNTHLIAVLEDAARIGWELIQKDQGE